MADFVYAPFMRLYIRENVSDKDVKSGILEENSTVAITPLFAVRGKNKRFLGCFLEITCFDIEATAANRDRFMPFIGRQVYPTFDCISAGFSDGPFEYSFYPELIPQRGMRYIHHMSGISYWPGWITFLDKGWSEFRKSFGAGRIASTGAITTIGVGEPAGGLLGD